MRVLLQFVAHARAIRRFQLPSLRFFPMCFFIPFVSPCQKMDAYIIIKGINGLGANLEEGHLHSNLIGIGRYALATASTAALPRVCLLVF